MPDPYDPYENYSTSQYTGPGLADLYTSSSPPFGSGIATSRPKSADKALGANMLKAGLTGGVSSLVDLAKGKLPFSDLFGGSNKPSTPYWQKLANKEWAQGNAALSAYSQLYEPTLNMARRSAADYGDLYRRAANDQLGFDIRSTTTKRNSDLADFERLGGDYVSQLRQTNPLLAQYYDTAQGNLALGSKLSPEMEAELEQYVRQGQASRGMGLGPTDIYSEALAKTSYGEGLRKSRMGEARDALGLYGDIFQATTGRPTMSPTPAGAQIQAPSTNIGLQDYLSQGINYELQDMNNAAAKAAGKQALTGQIIGGVLGSASKIGGGMLCWVAREVFGADNPKWMLFREWMLHRAPDQLRELYERNGERLAAKLREMPSLKPAIRAFMEEKIGELQAA